MMVAQLRPETDVPGLYLTGQDILSCGFTGALFAGVVSAQVILLSPLPQHWTGQSVITHLSFTQAILGRNVLSDLAGLHNKLQKTKVKITEIRKNI